MKNIDPTKKRLNFIEYIYNKYKINVEHTRVDRSEIELIRERVFLKEIKHNENIYRIIDKAIYSDRTHKLSTFFTVNAKDEFFIIVNMKFEDYYDLFKIDCSGSLALEIINDIKLSADKKKSVYRVSKKTFQRKLIKSYTEFEYEFILKMYSNKIISGRYVTPSAGIRGYIDMEEKIKKEKFFYVDTLEGVSRIRKYRDQLIIDKIKLKIEAVKKKKAKYDRQIRIYKQMITNLKNRR